MFAPPDSQEAIAGHPPLDVETFSHAPSRSCRWIANGVAWVPLTRIRENAMSSIQGVSSATAANSLQLQKPAAAPVAKDRDHHGDVDKAGPVDRDKGNNINVKA